MKGRKELGKYVFSLELYKSHLDIYLIPTILYRSWGDSLRNYYNMQFKVLKYNLSINISIEKQFINPEGSYKKRNFYQRIK